MVTVSFEKRLLYKLYEGKMSKFLAAGNKIYSLFLFLIGFHRFNAREFLEPGSS